MPKTQRLLRNQNHFDFDVPRSPDYEFKGDVNNISLHIEQRASTNRLAQPLRFLNVDIRLISSNGSSDFIKVGQFSVVHSIPFSSVMDVLHWADYDSNDLHTAFYWLFQRSAFRDILTVDDETLYCPSCVAYISDFYLAPSWRGLDIPLFSVAMLLEYIEADVVLSHPGFSDDLPEVRWLLMRYWRRLDLMFDEKANVLYQFDWTCPDWISDRLF